MFYYHILHQHTTTGYHFFSPAKELKDSKLYVNLYHPVPLELN